MINESTLTPEQQMAMGGQMRRSRREQAEHYGRLQDEYNSGVRRTHDTNDPKEIMRQIAADEAGGGGQPRSLREKVMAARRAMDIKQRAKDKIKEKITEPVKMGTNRALQWAWTVLIPSFGLSLIYINTHVFLRWVFPSAFCKLGEEWMPKTVSEHSSKNIAGTAFGIVEVMGLVLLDLVAFFIIFAIIAILVWLADNIIVKVIIKGVEALQWVEGLF
jgi:hypothetical protein